MTLPKLPIDAEKRRKMMEKMDKDLDQFMNEMALARQTTTNDEPFDFNKWCKKFDQHPLFMKELKPNENGEYSEAVQALQALKYDNENGNTPEELIEKAGDERKRGNKYYERKKYRWAIEAYTEGIRTYCSDNKLNAMLYFNRSAAQRRLGNLRSAFKDAMIAVKYDPLYVKAVYRVADCLLTLSHYRQCVDWVEKHLSKLRRADAISPESSAQLSNILVEAKEHVRAAEMLDAIRNEEDRRFVDQMIYLLREIHKRGISMSVMPNVNDDPESFREWYDSLKLYIPNVDDIPLVCLNQNQELVWPLIVQYPAHGRMDLIKDCAESTPLSDLFEELLQTPSDWDCEHEYREGNVGFYVEIAGELELWQVRPSDDLRKVLALPGVEVVRGVAVINLFTKEFAATRMTKVSANRYKLKIMKCEFPSE